MMLQRPGLQVCKALKTLFLCRYLQDSLKIELQVKMFDHESIKQEIRCHIVNGCDPED